MIRQRPRPALDPPPPLFQSVPRKPRAPPPMATPCCRPTAQIGRAHAELQSPCNLVCRLLLEKKKNKNFSARSHLTFSILHPRSSTSLRSHPLLFPNPRATPN